MNIPAGVTVTASAEAVFMVHGPVTIDGTLEGSCVAISLLGAGDVSIGGGAYPCDIRNYTVVTGGVPAEAGASGQHGGDGANGSGFVLARNGDLAFRGNVRIETQAGGAGGNGVHESDIAANASEAQTPIDVTAAPGTGDC